MNNDFTGLRRDELIELLLKSNQENSSLKNLVKTLTDDVRILKRYIFGKKSEKITPEDKRQGLLFDELEETLDIPEEEYSPKDKKDSKKPGRKRLSKDIPRERKVIDLNSDEKLCPCCKKVRPEISSEPTEELEFIPAKIIVRETIVKKYGACSCKEFQEREDLPQVIEAKAPRRFIPGSIATPSLVAHIITNKFSDALPFYRQTRIFNRIGVDISRQNMSNWCITASRKCEPLIEYMRQYLISGKLINMDETRIQVLKEKDRAAESNSFMWVMAGGQENKKVVLFNYSPTRKQGIPVKLLEGFQGILQTDGYSGYNKVVKDYGLTHIGCLAHGRRKFWELAEKTKKPGMAHKGVSFFARLYNVHNTLKEMNLPDNEFIKRRRNKSIPIWQEFYKWLNDNKNRVAPDTAISKAINYSINQYKNLVKYLKFADVSPDNNIAENAIRPFCVGRRNWLFNNTPRGAYSSAILYSLVETARINNIAPDKYLNLIFTEITENEDKVDFDSLMPWNIIIPD